MNKQLILNQRPVGAADANTWRIEETTIPTPKDGQILVQIEYVSLDPAMRGWLNDAKSYIAPVAIDEVMRSAGVGKVIASKSSKFNEGDYVVGGSGIQQYCAADAIGWVKVDPELHPLPKYLGVLGMPGYTAYFGLLEVGMPKSGETVLISGAAGAVGSVVGQIAKIKGCRVVGIAGSPAKCDYVVEELGFDACINYKTENIYKSIKEHCPQGIDIYFDNVGGDILNIALTQINRGARIPICGAISQYNSTEKPVGPSNYLSLLVNSARMEGFVVFHFSHKYATAATDLGRWLTEGSIKSQEHIEIGIENFLPAYEKLFSGEKQGKLVLKVSE